MKPMSAAWKSLGRTRMMARQYMAIIKLGFMPAKVRKLDTVSLRTAPAANSTATRIRSWVEKPCFSWVETTRFSAIFMAPFTLGFCVSYAILPAAIWSSAAFGVQRGFPVGLAKA